MSASDIRDDTSALQNDYPGYRFAHPGYGPST
jgi:hypothetical protein